MMYTTVHRFFLILELAKCEITYHCLNLLTLQHAINTHVLKSYYVSVHSIDGIGIYFVMFEEVMWSLLKVSDTASVCLVIQQHERIDFGENCLVVTLATLRHLDPSI